MSAQNSLPDQADVLAQLETANKDLAALRGDVTQLTSERDDFKAKFETASAQLTEANTKVTQLQGDVTKLTGERDTLKTDNTRLTGEMADFNKRLATELAKHGIRTFTQKSAAAAPERKLNATEKVLAAKGVQSLDQLASQKKTNS
ncbi:MAG TPA: hypothetical protein VHG89_04825 [Verrucomicrobiae bacterium]|nr:hypothetical protein [Verrucomicrobiae bacterium]